MAAGMVAAATLVVTGGVGSAYGTQPAATAAEPTMHDLGTLGGTFSFAHAVNATGQVVGSSTTASGQTHAFLWQDGRMTDLGTLGGTSSLAYAINDNGQVVGSSATASGQMHAFLWQDGRMTDLGTLGGTTSEALGINNDGVVVGGSYTRVAGQRHAFRWSTGSMTDISPSSTNDATALAVNETGEIVGQVSVDGGTYGFHWNDGATALLRPPSGGDTAVANDIASTAVVGDSWDKLSSTFRPTLWNLDPATATWISEYLSSPADEGASLTGIVERGPERPQTVVGHGATAAGQHHALLWSRDAAGRLQLTDLGSLNGSGYSVATDINVHGVVAGYSRVSGGGAIHAVIWQP